MSKNTNQDQDDLVDLNRVSGTIPEGDHRFRVVDAETRKGKNDPYWLLTCQVEEGNPDTDGFEVGYILSLGQKSRWKLEEFFDAVEAPREGKAACRDFIGSVFVGEVFTDEYESTNRETGAKQKRRSSKIRSTKVDNAGSYDSSPTYENQLPGDVGGAVDQDIPF